MLCLLTHTDLMQSSQTYLKSTPSMPYGQGIDLLTTPTAVVVKLEEAIEPLRLMRRVVVDVVVALSLVVT